MPESPGPVTADDLLAAARLTTDVIHAGADADWDALALELDWTCWETVEHLADDFWWYAAHLADGDPGDELAFDTREKRPGGPNDLLRVVPDDGAAGLARVLWATAVLHATLVRASAPTVRAWHIYGTADPEASAAMGVLEALAHTHDIAAGLGVPFAGDADLADRVLHRLMPDVERQADPWTDFLWACDRFESPDRPRRGRWRWFNDPADHPRAG